MKPRFNGALALAAIAGVFSVGAVAQDTKVDNGTDPTKLRRSVNLSYEHMDFASSGSRGSWELMMEMPVAEKVSLRLTLPVVSLNLPQNDFEPALGDVALRATYLHSVNRERGIVFQGEIFANTAKDPGRGYDSTVFKATAIYAKFLEGGRILAPALSHSEAIGRQKNVSETVLDLYYVPHLSNPAWYMTVDPALVHNWESDDSYASLAITTGRAVAKAGKGLVQVYLKPNVLMGHDRPADWSLELGVRAIGF